MSESKCSYRIAYEKQKKRTEQAEQKMMKFREILEEIDEWDLNWADGLDSNVERVKNMVRAALSEK